MEKIDKLISYFTKNAEGMELNDLIKEVGEDTFLRFINQNRGVYQNQPQNLAQVLANNLIGIFKNYYIKKNWYF
jgi:hypothetical protein